MDTAQIQKFTEVIFENINDGVVMLDRNFRIHAANRSIEKWVEKPASELIDKDCRKYFMKTGCARIVQHRLHSKQEG